MELPVEITPELIKFIRKKYALRWDGIHGWSHWLRVYENGLHLAKRNGADQVVVALFAFTHDMARRSDWFDSGHGPRAAECIQNEMQGIFFHLSPEQLNWLLQAVREHTNGHTQAELTVMTCWDADRLDLGRAGIYPSANHLCTIEAREPATIQWAYERSIQPNR